MIERITITDPAWKKRIGKTQITFGPFVNVLAGPNGSGKSSLMEAIMASGAENPLRVGKRIIFGKDRKYIDACQRVFAEADKSLEVLRRKGPPGGRPE